MLVIGLQSLEQLQSSWAVALDDNEFRQLQDWGLFK